VIKALLFDYGGVVADDSCGDKLYQQLAQSLGIDERAAWELFRPLWEQLTRGQITETELWVALEKKHGRRLPPDKPDIWNTWKQMPYFPEMLDFIAELKKDGYKVGLISTIIAVTAEDIRAHGGYDPFDPVILSYEVGYAKPDLEIYTIALERLPGIRPEEVIFLDDREAYLLPARALGIQTVLVKDVRQAIAETRSLLS
jgi:putative hydrolase of the HAD superfamily